MKAAALLSYIALFFFGPMHFSGANASSFGTDAAIGQTSSIQNTGKTGFFITAQESEGCDFHYFFGDQEDDNDEDSDDGSARKFCKDSFASLVPDYFIHATQYKKLFTPSRWNSDTTPLFIAIRVLRI